MEHAPSTKALAAHVKCIDESYSSRESFEALKHCRNVEKVRLMFIPHPVFVDAFTALQTLQLSTKQNLESLESVFDQDQRLQTEALQCTAQSTGALRRFHLMIGRQSRESWEAIATANPFLEEVEIKYFLDDNQDFSAGEESEWGSCRRSILSMGTWMNSCREPFWGQV